MKYLYTLVGIICIHICGIQNIFSQQLILHQTSAQNTRGHITTIDNAITNNNPGLVLIVTQKYGVYNPNEIGVWYSGGKWKIFNENRQNLPLKTKFNVLAIDPSKEKAAFVHTTTAANTKGHITTLNSAVTNGKSNQLLFVTQHYGAYNISPIGVWFSGGKWKIYNEDRKPIPTGTKFNVVSIAPGPLPNTWASVMGEAITHAVGPGNKLKFNTKHVSYLNHAQLNSKKNAYVFTTQNFKSTYNTSITGVWYDQDKWTVFNQDRKAIPDKVTFNVLALQPKFIPINIIKNINKTPVLKVAENKTNWKAIATSRPTGMYILPYKPSKGSGTTPSETSTTTTEMQGPNLVLPKNVNTLFSAELSPFISKLNVFSEIYEDKNPKSGFLYYLPKNYNLKWDKETGEYSFFIYYLSADAEGRGEVLVSAELAPNVNAEDMLLAEEMLSKQLGKTIKLRPLPLRDTPKVSFGNSLSNFDVDEGSVSTNVHTDFLEPIIVSWKMEQRVDDLIGAMMSHIMITGNVEFVPLDEEVEKVVSVPVKLKVNDEQTYGTFAYSTAAALLNGFSNTLDYPVVLKEIMILRKKSDGKHYIQKVDLGSYEVEPHQIFSSFTTSEKNQVLAGDIISQLWLTYSLKSCSSCNSEVQRKIMGGTSDSRIKKIEVQVLSPLEYSGANSLKLLIKSLQGDPNGVSEALLPMITIVDDNQTFSGGQLFIEDGKQPNFDYQMVLVQEDGTTLVSDWIHSEDLFIVLGESTIKKNFESTEEEPISVEEEEESEDVMEPTE